MTSHCTTIDLGTNKCLSELGLNLSEYGKSLGDFGLPQPDLHMAELTHEIQCWTGCERELFDAAEAQAATFNAEQLALYEMVSDAVLCKKPLCLFVDRKAGTGKTTVVKALCNKLCGLHCIVLPTAASAFAAQLYEGGRTTHSTFKVSLFSSLLLSSTSLSVSQVPVDEKSEMLKLLMPLAGPRSELIAETALLVWDEAPMANHAVLSCINDVLCDVMETDVPFGRKVIVLLGDFHQTCPVIPRALWAEVVLVSIKSSPLWKYFSIHRLIHPIRNAVDIEFRNFVNAIGDGGGPDVPFNNLQVVTSENKLINFVFSDDILADPASCATQSILAPTNCQVSHYNRLIQSCLEGECWTYMAQLMRTELYTRYAS